MFQLSLAINREGQQELNANFVQGDIVAWTFLLEIGGVPINLTGARARMTVAMPIPLILSTENGGIIMTNAVEGQFIVNISSTASAQFPAGSYRYDVWIEQALAPPVETQYITGTIRVNPSVSAVP